MNANVNTQIDNMVDSKEERQKYIDRVEVLEKVKTLLLIPQLEMATLRQLADFYEVDYNTIKLCYQRNKREIDKDGVISKKHQFFDKLTDGTSCNFRLIETTQYNRTYAFSENVIMVVPNAGVRLFPKRAALRFGMLLRDSKVAQEVRTQLLNIVEYTETENPQALTTEIDNEQELLMEVARTFSSGDMMKFAEATMKLNAYKDRHIKAVEKKNAELTEKNEALTKDNDILSGNILKWSNRASANKIVRLMASKLKWDFATTWLEIYNELLYKHGINLKARKTRDGRTSLPMLAFLHDDEWKILYQTIAAMLQARYINPSKLFEEAKTVMSE
jgi:DNA-binding transcriptional regulator YhcF (GntR family)